MYVCIYIYIYDVYIYIYRTSLKRAGAIPLFGASEQRITNNNDDDNDNITNTTN